MATVEKVLDTEQQDKLVQLIELLVAAGYFRARVSGLPNFDKIVGGLCWCIEWCAYDLDVELFYDENLTIGQKIALTEKIVKVLQRMQCPRRIEPHQIQGLDIPKIFPIFQWLLERVMQTRDEIGAYLKRFAVSEFERKHESLPTSSATEPPKEKIVKMLYHVEQVYWPRRRFRKPTRYQSCDDEALLVQTTLLEYGRKGVLTGTTARAGASASANATGKRQSVLPLDCLDSPSLSHLTEQQLEDDVDTFDEARIEVLMSEMQVNPHAGQQDEYLKGEDREVVKAVPESVRLAKQLEALQQRIERTKGEQGRAQSEHERLQAEVSGARERHSAAIAEADRLNELERNADPNLLESLRAALEEAENLKRDQTDYKAACKEEFAQLEQQLAQLRAAAADPNAFTDEGLRTVLDELEQETNKLRALRALASKRNREIALLERKIDEVPTQAELGQYQKRFEELYLQISAMHKQTKQFYILYNTLLDKKAYIEKEINLLNSIYETFNRVSSNPSAREKFITQLQTYASDIGKILAKLEQRVKDEKGRYESLTRRHAQLMEFERRYIAALNQFQDDCQLNERLQEATNVTVPADGYQ